MIYVAIKLLRAQKVLVESKKVLNVSKPATCVYEMLLKLLLLK